MDITQAIYNKLTADAALVGLIANYPSGSPGNPAIFTSWPVPPDAGRPYVFTRGEVTARHFDELASNLGLDVQRDVSVIADNTGSDANVEAIARRVRAVLHRQPLTIPNGSHVMTQCTNGPVPAETDDTLTGRQLTFRIVAMET
jgi:hypothetical protein